MKDTASSLWLRRNSFPIAVKISAEEKTPSAYLEEKGWRSVVLFAPRLKSAFDRIYKAKGAEFAPSRSLCTCGHFQENTGRYEPYDLRLFCAHLRNFYKRNLSDKDDSIEAFLLRTGQCFSGGEFFEREGIYCFTKGLNPWCDIYARQPHWIRFGYNLKTGKWKHGRVITKNYKL